MGHRQRDYARVKGYLSHLDNCIYMLGAEALLEEERARRETSSAT